jgi:hypothetical protein
MRSSYNCPGFFLERGLMVIAIHSASTDPLRYYIPMGNDRSRSNQLLSNPS